MKKIILSLAFLFVFIAFKPTTNADNTFFAPVCVTVNGEYVKTDKQAFLNGGVTKVSLRDIGDVFGADVLWNESTSTAEIRLGNTNLAVTKGKNTAKVNGKKVRIDSSAVIINDRIYVPLRFLSENLGAKVSWDANTLTADISSKNASVPSHLKGNANFTHDELYWLSRIVSAEAQGEVNNGKVAVANVILNRVESQDFPNTIYGVIFDRKYGVQFTPISNGTIYQTPTQESVIAAKRALLGENISDDCLYFLNPKTATNSWITNNREFFKSIGNHDFYL